MAFNQLDLTAALNTASNVGQTNFFISFIVTENESLIINVGGTQYAFSGTPEEIKEQVETDLGLGKFLKV